MRSVSYGSSGLAKRQISTALASSERRAKLTPAPSHKAPNGNGAPIHARVLPRGSSARDVDSGAKMLMPQRTQSSQLGPMSMAGRDHSVTETGSSGQASHYGSRSSETRFLRYLGRDCTRSRRYARNTANTMRISTIFGLRVERDRPYGMHDLCRSLVEPDATVPHDGSIAGALRRSAETG